MGWTDFFKNPAIASNAGDLQRLQKLLPADAVERLAQQVAASELQHSGEIKVCVEYTMPENYGAAGYSPRARAIDLFSNLRVWDTEHNNGVLLYLLYDQNAIEIVADRGFNRHLTRTHWQSVVDHMAPHLKQDSLEQAISGALHEMTDLLIAHFPPNPHWVHRNDLPNQPVLLG